MYHEEWFDLGDLFGNQAEVVRLVRFPIKGDRAQAVDEIQAAGEIGYVGFVAYRRRADGDLS
jgi:hypothetical protein